MIADSPNNCFTNIAIKILITPKLQTFRALFSSSSYSEPAIPAPPNRLSTLTPLFDG